MSNRTLSPRVQLALWTPLTVVALLALVLTWVFLVGPPVPHHFRFAAGAPGGAYIEFAKAYKEAISAAHIDMAVVETRGSVDNLRQLEDPDSGVVAALVQGGVVSPEAADTLVALGSVTREPLWLFYRDDRVLSRLGELAGRRIAVGTVGSGTRPVAMRLLEANGVDAKASNTELLDIGGTEARRRLEDGSLDAAFFVSSIKAPRIKALLENPELKLMSFSRADAYLRRYPFLTRVELPRGLVSLRQDLPPYKETLVGPSTMLVVRKDIHPDLIPVLLEAAKRTHRDGDLITPAGEFPSPSFIDLPLDKDARRYLERGPNWLYRVLPYRVAVQVDRLKILLLPMLTLMFPLFKLAPPVYRWRIRARVFRWYDSLWELDMRLSGIVSAAELEQARLRLKELEQDLARVRVPLSYMSEYYNLRVHLDLVRRRLDAVTARSPGGGSAAG